MPARLKKKNAEGDMPPCLPLKDAEGGTKDAEGDMPAASAPPPPLPPRTRPSVPI
jgi:hypothetical protein